MKAPQGRTAPGPGEAKGSARPVKVRRLRRPRPQAAEGQLSIWDLRLYITGEDLRSKTIIENLKRLCEEHLAGRYRIEVVDLLKKPHLAKADQICAIPTIIRKQPLPERRLIGNLAQMERVLSALDLIAAPESAQPLAGSPRPPT